MADSILVDLARHLYHWSVPPSWRHRFFHFRRYWRRGLPRTLIARLLLLLTSFHDHDLRRTFVITGSGRSGTTWLAETLAAAPRTAVLFEPLYGRECPGAAAAGFTWLASLATNDNDWAKYYYMRQVLEGKIRNCWTFRIMTPSMAISPHNWIVKFIRANLLLEWLTTTFPIPKPLLLIRHPCAVVASIRSFTEWPAPVLSTPWLDHRPELRSYFATLSTIEEQRAAQWVIETLAPLSLPRPWPFHLVFYEDLITSGLQALESVLADWRLPANARMQSRFTSDSATSRRGAARTRADRLQSWKRELPSPVIHRILDVVTSSGITFYNDSPVPLCRP